MWGFIVQINIGCCNWFCKKELEPCANYIIFYKGLGGKECILYPQDILCKYVFWSASGGGAIGLCPDTHMATNTPLPQG